MPNYSASLLVITYSLSEDRPMDDVINKFCFFILCSVIDHRGRQNVVRASVAQWANGSRAISFVLTTF